MNYLYLLMAWVLLATDTGLPHSERQQPEQKLTETKSAPFVRQRDFYKAIFSVPANTRIEGDFELALKANNVNDTLMVAAQIQVYDTYTKHNSTHSICWPLRTTVQKSTFEVGPSPKPKQVIVTFLKLPGASACEVISLPGSPKVPIPQRVYKVVSNCEVVGIPEKRILRIPTNHKYVEASVKTQCQTDSGNVSTHLLVSSSIHVIVRFRKHPMD